MPPISIRVAKTRAVALQSEGDEAAIIFAFIDRFYNRTRFRVATASIAPIQTEQKKALNPSELSAEDRDP